MNGLCEPDDRQFIIVVIAGILLDGTVDLP